MTTELINTAKQYFYKKEYQKALEIFAETKSNYETGLCYLLLKNEKEALRYWIKNKRNCPASSWGICVLRLINQNTNIYTTFFQIRAFYEVYLNLFLENNYNEWAQNMINSCGILFRSNPEIYKFASRVLYSNGYFDLAIKFAKKSIQIFYSDPEAFLILSQCQYLIGDLGEALDSVNRVMNMNDSYYPAIIFQKVLKEEIEKKRKI